MTSAAPDPVPDPLPTEQLVLRRFVRVMRVGALFALAIAALAVALVLKGSDERPIHVILATALGAGLSVLMGVALMTLLFLSARMGHDEAAATPPDKEEE